MSTSTVATTTGRLSGRRAQDLKQLAGRRRQAARMFARGCSQAEVASTLGVSSKTASRWHARWRHGGASALAAAARSGRPARLSDAQLSQLRELVLAGPQACGFDNDLWTVNRVQALVERRFGVRFHRSHIWRLLRSLGLSPQKPARRATERDEAKIARFIADDWPRIKQTRKPGARGSASKTRPASR